LLESLQSKKWEAQLSSGVLDALTYLLRNALLMAAYLTLPKVMITYDPFLAAWGSTM
jgi:hypothetical protein